MKTVHHQIYILFPEAGVGGRWFRFVKFQSNNRKNGNICKCFPNNNMYMCVCVCEFVCVLMGMMDLHPTQRLMVYIMYICFHLIFIAMLRRRYYYKISKCDKL